MDCDAGVGGEKSERREKVKAAGGTREAMEELSV